MSSHDVDGMPSRLARLLIALLFGLAFVGGTTVQAMPMTPAPHGVMPGCAEMAPTHQADAAAGMTPDCVKSMQCLAIPVVPARTSLDKGPGTYGSVIYWLIEGYLRGVSVPPAASPPRPV